MKTVYKIVRYGNWDGKHWNYKFLYHGINKSRVIPRNKWIKAERKWAGEGNNLYWTGIHCFETVGECTDYWINKFKKNKTMKIIKLLAKGIRRKPSNKKVLLANWIRL